MENPKKPQDSTDKNNNNNKDDNNQRAASENPAKPSDFRDKNKRKASQEEEDEDLLTLSLSFNYNRNVRARPVSSSEPEQVLPTLITPPVNLSEPVVSLPQHMHIQTLLLSQTSPPQLPFNHPIPVPVFVPQPQPHPPPSTIRLEALPIPAHPSLPPPPPPPPLAAESSPSPSPSPSSSRPAGRTRRHSSPGPAEGESKTITPPFPWATNRKAVVHTMEYLAKNNITTVTGDVHCKRCDRKYEMGFDLGQKFRELRRFIDRRKSTMHDRAPEEWSEPVLPTCEHCGQANSVKPIIEGRKKHSINWLFLFLGQLLGLCTLEQLKYFCKHTINHRTAAKDRLLYLTYLQLFKQLLHGQVNTS